MQCTISVPDLKNSSTYELEIDVKYSCDAVFGSISLKLSNRNTNSGFYYLLVSNL